MPIESNYYREPLSSQEKQRATEIYTSIAQFLCKEHNVGLAVQAIFGEEELNNHSENFPINERGDFERLQQRGTSSCFTHMGQNGIQYYNYFPTDKARNVIDGTSKNYGSFVEELSHAIYKEKQRQLYGVIKSDAVFTEFIGVIDRFNFQYHHSSGISIPALVNEYTPAANMTNNPVYSLSHRWGRFFNSFLIALQSKNPQIASQTFESFYNFSDKEKFMFMLQGMQHLGKQFNIDTSQFLVVNRNDSAEVQYIKNMAVQLQAPIQLT